MKHARIMLFLAAFAALLIGAALLPLEQLLTDLQAWAADRGAVAFIAVTLVIALGFLLLLPASLFMMLAGFLFGFDTIVISGAEQRIQSLWRLNGFMHGLCMSAALWGTVLCYMGRRTDRVA